MNQQEAMMGVGSRAEDIADFQASECAFVTIPRVSAEQILQHMQEAYQRYPSRQLRISLKNLAHYLGVTL